MVDSGVGLAPERLALLRQLFEQSADALWRGQEGLGIGWAFVCYVRHADDQVGNVITHQSPAPLG